MKHILILSFIFLATTNSFAQTSKPTIDTSLFAKPAADTMPYAVLYFYRSYINPLFAPIKKVKIYLNDSLIYQLKANMMFSIKILKEGKYIIAIDKKGDSDIPLTIKKGNEYFFKCDVVMGLWFGKPTLVAVSVDQGKRETGILKEK
jgi:hypothetical protein